MKELSLEKMERIGGSDGIPWEICAVAFTVSMFGPIGLAIGGPTSLGCLLYGENILGE